MDTHAVREALLALARNHHWTWSAETRSVFAALPGHDPTTHPATVVTSLDDAAIESVASNSGLVEAIERTRSALEELTADTPAAPDIAYFSPEFGISDLVPQYSGGLGILAGDHLKAASDLGLSLGAVGLFYREGFFRQSVAGIRQTERYETYQPEALGCLDTGSVVTVPMAGRDVMARVWRLDVGRVPLLLLDTDVAANTKQDRAITDRLYSGDRRHRLEQELVLGVGGARALAAVGWEPPVLHLNEGHAGFLILSLIDRRIEAGSTLAEAIADIGPGLVFTTHTPVPAGIDTFDLDLLTPYLAPWAERWDLPVDDIIDLGLTDAAITGTDATASAAAAAKARAAARSTATDDRPDFNMAALCLKAAGRANGVSKLHGQVSRDLFASVPGGSAIGSVTNGVHARTWVMPRLQDLFDQHLGPDWADGDGHAWKRVADIDDDAIRAVRRAGSEELAAMVAERTDHVVDPDSLIVGFARRFATYKRADLLLHHPEHLATLLADDERPITFVFAGKAHPADTEGKTILADVVAYTSRPESKGRFLFVPDYDIAVAQALYAGSDVWLNHPIRPHEASGTSGEKSALNGGLNCSISDGWWDEMADGINGWTIPNSTETKPERRDLDESLAALALLADEIVPLYHGTGRGAGESGPMTAGWIERVRHNWTTLGPKVTAARMVSDYRDTLYGPALDEVRQR